MTTEERDRLSKLAARFAEDLGEHFDAVQILACVCDDEGTSNISRGSGNWFARQGMAHEFIAQDMAETTGKGVARELNRE